MLSGQFNPLVWASDNWATAVHYYEGCIIEIDVALDRKCRCAYVQSNEALTALGKSPDDYCYGGATALYPKGARWYSFSKKYLQNNLRGIREIALPIAKKEYVCQCAAPGHSNECQTCTADCKCGNCMNRSGPENIQMCLCPFEACKSCWNDASGHQHPILHCSHWNKPILFKRG